MFEEINSLSEVELELIEVKSKHEWRDELIAFGLAMNERFFSIKDGVVPIYLAFADASYTSRFGNRPRITLSKDYDKDRCFQSVCEKYNLKPINNYGGTIEGYDFDSDKTAKQLCSFLVGFENAYRKVKNSK